MRLVLPALLVFGMISCARRTPVRERPEDTVRVAAIQCASEMGQTADNLSNMAMLAGRAAAQGAQIVVFPECAVQGYMDPSTMTSWSKSEDSDMNVREIAESIPGPSTRLLGDLARELKVYICAGIVERSDGDFYNSQVLLDPDGALAGHHRKKSMWTPGDSLWCRRGDTPVQVVDTEFGRLGLMICHDFHILPPKLAEQGADIVLYSVGWYGPNEKNWFSNIFPRRAVVPHGFDVVVANWSGRLPNPDWPGSGHSCIISGAGEVLAMARSVHGNEIVIADITIRNRKSSTAVPSELREEI